MYEIKSDIRNLDGVDITTYSRDITRACVLEVEAGSNGYQGGDYGHGSRTYIRIEDKGGSDMDIVTHVHPSTGEVKGIEIHFGGDHELANMIDALKFITQALEDAIKEN